MSSQPFPIIGVHLDLKYLMPRKDYLCTWLRELAGMGINTILLEYEDKFPFRKYPFLRAAEAFAPDELEAFLREARRLGLRIIPLVQTLSHMEFALAHEELAHLRELPHIHTQINPHNPDAVAFVKDLVDEVLAWHEPDEMFHLGADEAWHLGHNPGYAREVQEKGMVTVWAEHERKLIHHAAAAGKRPIVWDDVFWRDPEAVTRCGLPKELVLASWDYAITDSGLGQPGGMKLRHVDVYRKHGFDVLAVPCLNWGDLIPQHEHCLRNTGAWAQKARSAGALGVLNSAWASFHTPLPTHMLHNAATVDLFSGRAATIDLPWEHRWIEDWFGASPEGVPQALRDASRLWHRKVPGLERPIGVVIYSYMDMILHYSGGQTERRARGAYPLDWSEIDSVKLHRKKLALLRNEDSQQELRGEFGEIGEQFRRARDVLRRLAAEATRHQAEASLLAVLADVKELWTRVAHHQILGEGDARRLLNELEAAKPSLVRAIEPYYEPPSIARIVNLWWRPVYQTLAEDSRATGASS